MTFPHAGAGEVLTFCAASCVPVARSGVLSDSDPDAHGRLRWHRFEWVGWKHLPRSAILVPVLLGRKRSSYWFQLDTGAASSSLYGTPDPETAGSLVWEEPRWARAAASVGGANIAVRLSISEDTLDPPRAPAGTIGLDALAGHVLVLDLPRQRFVVISVSERQRVGLREQVDNWIPVTMRDGKAVAQVHGGHDLLDLFYDSGASSFEIVTTEPRWRALTGRSGSEDDNARLEVPSWGDTREVVGAPARFPFDFGSSRHENVLVWHDVEGGFSFESIACDGLFGNALFQEQTLILDCIDSALGLTADPIQL